MNYENLYKEALERAKNIYGASESKDILSTLTTIFPELKESEDEKIRKYLLKLAERCPDDSIDFMHEVKKEDVVAWLEKQGESKFEQCIKEGDEIVTNEYGTHFNISQLERVSQKATDTKETAKEFLKTAGIMDKNEEQLAEEYMQEKSSNFHIGDTVKIHCCGRPKHIQDIYNNKVGNIDCIWDLNENPWGNIGVRLENGCNNLFFESELEIVEPKFKDGDWVVCEITGSVYQIENCIENPNNHKCGYLTNGGYISSSEVNHYHLWTIEDAKVGDVLATEDKNFATPFVAIYESLDDIGYEGPTFNSHCFIGFNGNFYTGEEGHAIEDIHPATKEQRDLLFLKMKEAGFEWNADKKELKKIEQKPAELPKVKSVPLSFKEKLGIFMQYTSVDLEKEENQQLLDEAAKELLQLAYSDKANEIALASAKTWGESMAILMAANNAYRRGQKEQKPAEWREEDEENLNQLHKIIVKKAHEEYEIDTEDETLWGKHAILDNWLKSLKERIKGGH